MQEEGKYAKMWVRDGILFFTFKPVPELTLEKAKTLVARRLMFQTKVLYPILCDIHNLKTISEEAADFMAKEGSAMTPAIALLCSSYYHRVLAKIFIEFHCPRKPIELFYNKQEAIEYLRRFIK